MKIYLDARWTRTDYHDGISRYGAGVIQGFKENDIPITLLIDRKEQLKMLPEGIPYILINNPISIKELLLPFKLNRLGADVVFSPMQIMGSFGRKYKLLFTLHDIIYYHYPKAPTNLPLYQKIAWRLFYLTKTPQRLFLNRADHVITVSELSKSFLQKYRLTKREISVIYNAPSLTASQIQHNEARTTNIVYMGSFMPYKNTEVLIKGMTHLPPDFTLHLLSKISDERKAELTLLVGPGVNVVFHNGVSDDEYIKLLQGAFCLAFGSKEEGFGLPIIEAQTLGTPVVCSDMTIFHEVAGDGALFFDYDNPKQFADQVMKLNDTALLKDLVEKGHRQAKKFTWKRSAAKLYGICEKLYDGK